MVWLNPWRYRKKCNIKAGSGAGIGYQQIFKIYYTNGTDSVETLNNEIIYTVFLNGKCKADFTDVVFTAYNSTTVYSQKICSVTEGAFAVIAVKINEDLDNNQSINIYYGNPMAVVRSYDDTFIDVIDGVVSAITLGESSGTTSADYSGYGNTATITNTEIVDSPFFIGEKARYFTGTTGEIITIPAFSAANVTEEFTVIIYFSPASGNPDYAGLITKSGRAFVLRGNPNSRMGGYVYNSDDTYINFSIPVGQSTVLNGNNVGVLTFNRPTVSCYLGTNKTLNTPTNVNFDYNIGLWASNPINIGTLWGFTFKGTIGHTIMLNKYIDSSKLSTMYANYPDTRLLNGKICVRKWATTTLPSLDSWEAEEGNPNSIIYLTKKY